MRIGLDFDGVIADSQPLKSQVASEMFGVEIHPDKFRKALVIPNILTADQYKAVQKEMYEVFRTTATVQGANIHIWRLLTEGHKISVVTSRVGVALKNAKMFLRLTELDLPIVGVGIGVSKADACKGLDVYVDDDLDKLEPLIGIVPKLFLYSWGYNAHEKEHGGIRRVWSWSELYEQL